MRLLQTLALAAIGLAVGGCGERSPTFREDKPGVWTMIVPQGFAPDQLLKAVKERCAGTVRCDVIVYDHEAYLAPNIAEDERWGAAVLSYSRSPGFEKAYWNCSVYRDPVEGECRGEPIIDPEFPEIGSRTDAPANGSSQ